MILSRAYTAALASLLVVVFAPDARAQTPSVPWNTEPDPVPSTPSTFDPLPAEPPPSSEPSFWSRAGRIGVEVLGVAGAGLLTTGAGYGLACALDHGRCSGETWVPVALGLGFFTVPAGVTLTGQWMGARGGFGWSVLGELAGTALATPIALLSSRRPWLAVTAAIALPLAGAIAGYEISTESPATDVRHARSARPARWAPTLAVSPEGAAVGVVGVF